VTIGALGDIIVTFGKNDECWLSWMAMVGHDTVPSSARIVSRQSFGSDSDGWPFGNNKGL
jgi:hypothetical protein